jgi:hypothetical protein
MNYIKHLTGFFERMIYEDSLNPTHISLYIALFQFWNIKRFTNPIHISREETMRLSKISSKATYHKCMRDLHEKNYVIYEPSFNPYRGSKVTIINLELTDKDVQKTVRKHTIKKTSTKQLAEHLIEPTNEPSINDSKLSLKQPKKGKQRERKNYFTPPTLEEVISFFKENKCNTEEAEPFHLYYQANGWIVGKAKMKNWQAAAKNWMLRSKKFQAEKVGKLVPYQLHAKPTNYEETL